MGQSDTMSEAISRARSLNYLHQVRGSVVYKAMAVATSFVAIPLMIHYLGQEQFGVWSTLLSVMTWVTFFDLGLGNGLRNKLAESLAKDQTAEARSYISSAYSLIGLIAFAVFILLALSTFIIPWQRVFNSHSLSAENLSHTVLITCFFITLNFWVSLINAVLNAVQKTSLVVMGQLLSSMLSLIFVYVLTKTTAASLLYLATAYGISIVGANVLLSGWFYKNNMRLMPKLSLDFGHMRPLLNLGLQFFVIQIAVLVIFTTDKIFITQLFGPALVTSYEVVFKYFGIISLTYGLFMAPLWSSYTDAFHRNDLDWIRRVIRKQLWLFGLVIVVVVSFVLAAKSVISLWVGKELAVPLVVSASVGLFVLLSTWNNIFAYLLNGVGRMRLQLYSAILAMFANIPIAILYTRHLGLGVEGVVLAMCTSLLPFAVIGPLETVFVLRRKKL